MRNLIQFGKNHIVDDSLGGKSKGYKKGNITMSRAIRVTYPAWPEQAVKMDPLMPVNTFSCGSEYADWTDWNCGNCKKQKDCQLITRIDMAYLNDGKIPFKTAKRIGFEDVAVQSNGFIIAHLKSECNERLI